MDFSENNTVFYVNECFYTPLNRFDQLKCDILSINFLPLTIRNKEMRRAGKNLSTLKTTCKKLELLVREPSVWTPRPVHKLKHLKVYTAVEEPKTVAVSHTLKHGPPHSLRFHRIGTTPSFNVEQASANCSINLFIFTVFSLHEDKTEKHSQFGACLEATFTVLPQFSFLCS